MNLHRAIPKPRGFLCLAVLTVASSAVVPAASAAIGISFGGTTPLANSETSGVVPKASWNNAAGATSASALKLNDDTGAATNVTATWKADNVWNTPVADTAGNNRMMRGYLDTGSGNPSTVTLAGLASGSYNIYVYADGDNSGVSRSASYQISGQGVTTAAIGLTDSSNANFAGTFIPANSGSGNYVLFSNVKISSGLVVTATPGSSDYAPRAPLNGIQIVPVSVPSPDFTLATSSNSQTVTAGNSATYVITAGAVNGFAGTISLSAAGLPAGASASFNPTAIGGGGSSTLTVTTVGSTPAATTGLTFTGVSGSISHSTAANLVVTTAPQPTGLSVHFVGTGNSMAAGEVAGAFPKSNWNNAAGAASTAALSLKSETGSSTGASITWTSDNTWRTSVADAAGNNRMMSGYLDNGSGNASTVRVSGVTPGNYDILVYVDGDNQWASRTGSYQISGSGITARTISATDAQNVTFNGAFAPSSNSNGNYVVFSGVAINSGFTLTATPAATGDVPRAPVNGIQILPSTVTTPGSAVTLSLTPGSSTLSSLKTQQFTASVAGSTNTAVTWGLSPNMGTISTSGMYTAPSTMSTAQTVTVSATSVADPSKSATASISLTATAPALTIGTATIPGGTGGTPYSTTLAATGGTAPYTWQISAGTLPTGLNLGSSSGTISGTPAAGSYSFTVRVADNAGGQATKAYSVTMQAAAVTQPAVATYYVALNGNDGWSGQLAAPNASNSDGPFQTLRKAQSAMQGSSRKVTTIRGGTYSVASGMTFTTADNGQTWTSYPGETAVLDGGGQGSLRMTNPNHITLQGLTFRNMGADGLFIDYGDAFIIQSNVFINCRLGCITGNFVTNSLLDSNTIDGQSPGNPAGNNGNAYSAINMYGTSSNNKVTHNLIKNTQGGGIAFSNGPTQSGCSNNIIDRNRLENVDTNVVDFGAIYIYDPSHAGVGNQITNNVVDGYGGPNGVANAVKGIYLDDLTSNVLVSGNVVRNGGAWAWLIHGGDRNTITNNVWDLSSSGTLLAFYQVSPIRDYGMTGNVFTKNIVYSASTFPSSLYLVYIDGGDALPASSNNLYYSATGANIPNSVVVDSNRLLTNPQFASPSTGNYSMSGSSPALTTLGFTPLPTDQGPVVR